MRFQRLESRRLLTGWVVELPASVDFVSVAQAADSDSVCLAYVGNAAIGSAKLTSPAQAAAIGLISFESGTGIRVPHNAVDAVFGDDEAFQVVGSAMTDTSIPGGNGEPTKWIDGQAQPSGLQDTIAGHSGTFHAVHRNGRIVGEDDLQPIIHEAGQTQAIPLPGDSAIGAALDLNDDRIVGYADDDAVLWKLTDDRWSPTVFAHHEGSTFGTANSISKYGITGGSYRSGDNASTPVGMLWGRDGEIMREFDGNDAGAVTHVIDHLAAIESADGSLIYAPWNDSVSELDDFLRQTTSLDVPDEPLRLTDMELSPDGKRILILYELQSDPSQQWLSSLDVQSLPIRGSHPWNRYDVNNDGVASVIDALFVLNRLGRDPSPTLPPGGNHQGPFYDVNGNDEVTPLDALQVINHLARNGGGGPSLATTRN